MRDGPAPQKKDFHPRGQRPPVNDLRSLLLVAAFLFAAGCTGTTIRDPVTPASTLSLPPAPAVSSTGATSTLPTPDRTDEQFLEAVALCYNNTPVIADRKTNLDFTTCMQHTPVPEGFCARQFRSEILEYTTKDDDTTAGYHRETMNMQVARTRYSRCTGMS